MALKASTGLRNAMLEGDPFAFAIASPLIIIYSGTPPATADAAITGSVLSTISADATGDPLTWGVAANGTLPKDPSQVWRGVNTGSGTATHWRMVASDDTGLLSTIERRLQGLCGVAGSDLNMSSINLTSGASQTIDACNVSLPTF